MNKSVDKVVRQAANMKEADDVRTYMRLAQVEKQKGHLTANEAKRFNRARVRLIRAGIVRQIGRAELEATARQALADLPWWRRWWLKIRFRVLIWRKQREQQ
jgi:hypothetical protein